MASFPTAKVHRVSRRQLGRGQHVQAAAAVVTPTVSTVTVTLTFNVPVIVSGNINLHLSAGNPLISQVQNSPTVVTQVYTSTAATATWSIHAGEPVATFQGGGLAPASGTF